MNLQSMESTTTQRRSNAAKPSLLFVFGLLLSFASVFSVASFHASLLVASPTDRLFLNEEEEENKSLLDEAAVPRSRRKLSSSNSLGVSASHTTLHHDRQHWSRETMQVVSRHHTAKQERARLYPRETNTAGKHRHVRASREATVRDSPRRPHVHEHHGQPKNWWKDMDLRKEVTRCGVEKCFFPSLSNHESIGYLVAGSSMFPIMKEAYDLAQTLHQEFGMQHLNLNPPRLVSATTEWMSHLNQLVNQPGRRAGGFPTQDVYGTSADEEDLHHLVVQKVRRAPEPHLFLTIGENQALTEQTVATFAATIRDRHAFDRHFGYEMRRIRQVLRAYPVLHHDFQGLVDTQGRFYAMDLDLAEEWKNEEIPENINSILQEADIFLEQVRKQLWNHSFQREQRQALYRY